MYNSQYKFESKPFELRPDPAFLWLGEKYKEVLSTLRYGILANKGFLLLTGSGGMGKTTLINSLVEGLGDDVECAIIPDPRLDRLDFYNEIAAGFGMNTLFSSKVQFLIQFSHFLHKAHDEKKKTLLLIDDCHLLSQDMLEELRLLSNIEKADAKLINIFFIGEPQFNEVLVRQKNKAVRQRLTLKLKLLPLNVNETGEYIQHRLCAAGGVEKIFSTKAIQLIYKHSRGVPRYINVLCEYSLQAGAARGKKSVDHRLIKECVQRLDLSVDASPDQVDLKLFDRKNQNSNFQRDTFVIERNNGLPTMSGVSVENESGKRGWLLLLPLLFLACSFVYYFYPQNNVAHTVGKEKKQERPVVLQESLVKVTTSPAASVLKSRNLEINEKKAAALKHAILSNAYREKPEAGGEAYQAVVESRSETVDESVGITRVEDQISTVDEEAVAKKEENSRAEVKAPAEKLPESKEVVGQPEKDIPPMEPVKIILPLRPNSLQLTRQAKREFVRFVKKLRKYPGAQVLVKGYVSSDTDSPENRALSDKRAEAVGRLLMKYGIDREQLEIRGMGISDPIADNKTGVGRRKNRRVEIEVLNDGR
ncbi:AAA family ATPase [Desulfomarina sp.]